MTKFSLIAILAVTALLCSCESNKDQQMGNAEKRETARRQAAQDQAPVDQSQANLLRAQQGVVNRDGNPGRDLTGY